MATVSSRHAGGRLRAEDSSPLFLRISAIAKLRGISISRLAQAAGISRQCIHQIKSPRAATAKAIAKALAVPLEFLVQDAVPAADRRGVGGRPRVRPASAIFQRIESLAQERGLRLDQLAERANISVATIYNISDPKVSTAKAIADSLGVTLDALLQQSEPIRRASQAARRPA
jgi:transcriptional regulator with XRE-family HTH domain